jgi:hypothetical protein
MLQEFAYLDAGTGSLFIQAILGTALAGVAVFRTYIRRFFAKFKPAYSRQTISDEEV